jgi:7-cyano-7-deazaguanine synthase in queuosine biosynthesis
MKRAETLVYKNFKPTKKGFRFYYRIDNEEYSFWISTNHSRIEIDDESKNLVLGHIGLSFLVDIAVICLPRRIVINALSLSDEQLQLWKWMYEEASLERAYVEKTELFFLDTIWEINHESNPLRMFSKDRSLDHVIISMSGGKESITALNLFKKYPYLSLLFFDYNDKNSFYMRKAYDELRKEFDNYQINTNISHTGRLVEKYECKYYSMFIIGQLIFNTLLYSDKIDYLIIGNEYSSNFGNANYKGMLVNHQFDKTIQFAERVNNYIKKYFNGVITYTSPFFGLYEYRIAELFFFDNNYLDIWTSCNNSNSKHNFCCRCPKCAFIYIISLPFVEKSILDKYFFESPLEKIELCKPLINIHSDKPIDCVGEKKECWVALYKILEQNKASESRVVQYYKKEILPLIGQDLQKMELEITTEQSKFVYFPEKLLKHMPANFFASTGTRITQCSYFNEG